MIPISNLENTMDRLFEIFNSLLQFPYFYKVIHLSDFFKVAAAEFMW